MMMACCYGTESVSPAQDVAFQSMRFAQKTWSKGRINSRLNVCCWRCLHLALGRAAPSGTIIIIVIPLLATFAYVHVVSHLTVRIRLLHLNFALKNVYGEK
ncbi:hypothetical protein XELAEV_18021711mg [Xenopus laevis]|uniref:Uncharacterized protein n=1 Tax=Xenopus laevis TaxID=8355 RepID=A0A974HMQ4_XENLA|nr:hypothetical protein XELAEV_18021711mg [Xenopus laevis]